MTESWHALSHAWRFCSSAALGLLFPAECAACRVLLGDGPHELLLCERCRGLLTPSVPQCPFCAAQLAVGGAWPAPKSGGPDRCVHCRAIRWRFDRIHSLGPYNEELRTTVLRIKTPADEPLARAAGTLLAIQFAEQLAAAAFDVVVPVPMHPIRRLEHGTNSAETLAESLAERLDLPACSDGLIRTRSTERQTMVAASERWHNLRGAIAVETRYDWAGARVLLVDDVVTTGATVNECSRALQKTGVAAVEVICLARSVGEKMRRS